jgi:hypothetical protein
VQNSIERLFWAGNKGNYQKMIPHKWLFSLGKKLKKKKNSKWTTKKKLIFQLRQFSIFFEEIFIDLSFG